MNYIRPSKPPAVRGPPQKTDYETCYFRTIEFCLLHPRSFLPYRFSRLLLQLPMSITLEEIAGEDGKTDTFITEPNPSKVVARLTRALIERKKSNELASFLRLCVAKYPRDKVSLGVPYALIRGDWDSWPEKKLERLFLAWAERLQLGH